MSHNQPKPSPRSVVVTGGSRGIGRATALAFARAGARMVAIGYVDNEAAARATGDAVEALGATCVIVRANLARPDEVDRFFDEVGARSDTIDAFVHCAALAAFKPLLDTRVNQWDLTMNVNARSFLLCVQRCIHFMRTGGRIVAVSSLGGQRVLPGYGAMGPTKSALEGLTRSLAVELAPRGIGVNAVSAGLVRGTAASELPGAAAALAAALGRTPLGRIAGPDEIAGIIHFLTTPASDFIIGQTIIADGGYSLG